METLFFAAMGWCGTKYPGWWRGPKDPDPEPWWRYLTLSIIGIGVGIVSGLAFNNTVVNETIFSGQAIVASGLVSFAVSNIVTGLASSLMKDKEVR